MNKLTSQLIMSIYIYICEGINKTLETEEACEFASTNC